jgi:hypothetical protein
MIDLINFNYDRTWGEKDGGVILKQSFFLNLSLSTHIHTFNWPMGTESSIEVNDN